MHTQQPWPFAYVVAAECLRRVAFDHSGEAIHAFDRAGLVVGWPLVGCQVSDRSHGIPAGLGGQDGSAWQVTTVVRGKPYMLGLHNPLVHNSTVIVGLGKGRGPDRGRQDCQQSQAFHDAQA